MFTDSGDRNPDSGRVTAHSEIIKLAAVAATNRANSSESGTIQELSDFALPYGVTRELSAVKGCTHARFLERDFGTVMGQT